MNPGGQRKEAARPSRVGAVPEPRLLDAGLKEVPGEVRLSSLEERLPVIVLAGGVTALGVLRAFGRAGVPVFVHPGTDDPIRYSRWYRPLLNGSFSAWFRLAPHWIACRTRVDWRRCCKSSMCRCR